MRPYLFVLMAWALAACTDKTPASVEFTAPQLVLSSNTEAALAPLVRNQAGEALDIPVHFSAKPAEVAVITNKNGLRCIRSGDVLLTAEAGPASKRQTVRCRIVASIKMPPRFGLIIPNDPVASEATALDEGQRPLTDVTPKLSAVDPTIVVISQGKLVARRVGVTKLIATAGDQQAEAQVTVIRKIKSQPLLLNDGERYNLTLGQGHYAAEVKVESRGTTYGVTLQWIGGTGCEDRDEAQELTARCTITNTGSLVVENPTTLGLGPPADGFLNLYELP